MAAGLHAQGLQLLTNNVDPDPYHNAVWTSTGPAYPLPLGPVTFPTHVGIYWPAMDLSRAGDALTVRGVGRANYSSSGGFATRSDLVTDVSTPAPARITIQIRNVLSYIQYLTPSASFGVGIGADGVDEFAVANTWAAQTTSATLTTHCDSVGTLVRWYHVLGSGPTSGGGLDATNDFTVSFAPPAQEATYGPACAGALGCQMGSGAYDRVFVGSFPSGTTFAWIMAGNQQTSVLFPGLGCPLLVTPQIVVSVPVFTGPNGRMFVDFDPALPQIPGLVFFAQGVAFRAGTLIGTNGVRVQL